MSKQHKNTTGAKLSEVHPLPLIYRHVISTKDGNYLSFFYNQENNLLVVDLVAKSERGGNEIVRMTLDEKKLLKNIK